MKTTLIILLGLLLCGCSQKQPPSSGPAIDRVQVGDTIWHDGPTTYALHVTERDEASLKGVSISGKLPTGQTATVSADSATLSAISNATDDKSVMITLHNAKMQTGSESSALGGDYPMTLHE